MIKILSRVIVQTVLAYAGMWRLNIEVLLPLNFKEKRVKKTEEIFDGNLYPLLFNRFTTCSYKPAIKIL